MGMDDYKRYVELADEYGQTARTAMPQMRGSERGPMAAALATMYAHLAGLEVALIQDDRRERVQRRHAQRITTLERLAGVAERQMPDPFDEPATVGV